MFLSEIEKKKKVREILVKYDTLNKRKDFCLFSSKLTEITSAYREEVTSETFSTYEFHEDSSVQSSATFEARGSGLG